MLKVLMFLLLAVSVCSADIVNVDFGTQALPGLNGAQSYTFTQSGVSITLTALMPLTTLQHTGEGIGIGPVQTDEVGFGEFLRISFSPPADQGSFTVSQLYWAGPWWNPDHDKGAYQLNGAGSWIEFSGAQANGAGVLTVPIGSQISSITFGAPFFPLLSDYSLQGVQLSVPDGGVTLMLLGGVLVGLESLRRRVRS